MNLPGWQELESSVVEKEDFASGCVAGRSCLFLDVGCFGRYLILFYLFLRCNSVLVIEVLGPQ